MRNIQVIDGADNCTFQIFAATDEEFAAIFPEAGQDLEFIEDVVARLGDASVAALMAPIWTRPVRKRDANGIHGTLFYGFQTKRDAFPQTKCEKDWNAAALNDAQRRMD